MLWWFLVVGARAGEAGPLTCGELKAMVRADGEYASQQGAAARGVCETALACVSAANFGDGLMTVVRANLKACGDDADANEAPPVTVKAPAYECSALAIKSTTPGGGYAAPGSDASGKIVDATKLPIGWTPVGGGVGGPANTPWVIICREVK